LAQVRDGVNGVNAVTEVPSKLWDIDAYYSPDPQAAGRMVARRGDFLSGIDRFDAALLGISPREAISFDPLAPAAAMHMISHPTAWHQHAQMYRCSSSAMTETTSNKILF
jgi:hypothetical protein